MPRQYPKEFRDPAVRLVTESREDHETEWAAIQIVASWLNVGAETLRKWMRRSEIDAGSGLAWPLRTRRRFAG